MLGDASEECSAAPLDRWLALSREARELTCVAAPRRCAAADAERALSEAVRARAPLLIEGGCADWPAVQRWRCDEYLAEACGEAAVTVDWTPDGRADSVMRARDADSEGKPREEGAERRGGELPLFVQPLQRRSTMASFLEQLRATRGEKAGDEAPANEGAERRMNVPYLSAQCGNLDSELGALLLGEWLFDGCHGLPKDPARARLWLKKVVDGPFSLDQRSFEAARLLRELDSAGD